MRNACRLGLALGISIALIGVIDETSLATPVDPEILERIGPRASNPGVSKRNLVERGRKLFFEETFEGNGRTCGTCHPATNNFTIDPAFIARLPRRDPLFVAEFNRDLRDLENPKLMRKFGLILENLDGLPPQQPVFRGVPHNIGMAMSIESDLDRPGHATGWSGDGAPVDENIPGADGSIRAFLIGGIIQHFPKTLNRVPGVDFELPDDDELDAVEAFLRSLGRQKELDLAAMQFSDQNVDAGRRLFLGDEDDRSCHGCHGNAGANNDEGLNGNFDTGTRTLSQNRRFFNPPLPPDGGFGNGPNSDGGFGDGSFNVPSLVEAADTPPFFHMSAVPSKSANPSNSRLPFRHTAQHQSWKGPSDPIGMKEAPR